MKGLFSGESGIGKALTKIGELVVLSILWFFTSLPVVTIGVSTTALYYAMVKSVRMDRGYFFKEYFKAWKDNFLRSTGIMIFFFICRNLLLCCIIFPGAPIRRPAMPRPPALSMQNAVTT